MFFPCVDRHANRRGDVHTCALMTAGSVKCWGMNEYGQLGSGSTANMQLEPMDGQCYQPG